VVPTCHLSHGGISGNEQRQESYEGIDLTAEETERVERATGAAGNGGQTDPTQRCCAAAGCDSR
jgi:hypothetical protein